ncbi:SDR family oxidoreductase [Corynebacterium sp. TAE3-ERU12]|uniref:SDR family NAD(P)-dependent oxidoreductase n=1 Tax=Corynebacterium sp. TAE3-ERU12 TaxID=2849491 RepID=UPI001C48E6B4|nr:SDR family oxidoreductase [Corynebacterium sp. TAE3-ERU12]MBV7294391.1 SDR family oxidoreductase [Corynebacterium sp. TAE3-ERU12]
MTNRIAVITGASSGIGAATAEQLAAAGWEVHLCARRTGNLQRLADSITNNGGVAEVHTVDITNQEQVDALADALAGRGVGVLVNNAGGAWGLESVEDAVEEKWRWMYEVNVLGTLRVTRALLPELKSASGAVINVGSVAGRFNYVGGAGYNAAKHGERSLTEVLRKEIAADGVRVTEVDPGRVQTDFSLVRFDGDAEKADAVYAGKENLTAEDIGEVIRFVADRPAHVNIDFVQVTPIDQTSI